MSSSTLDTTDAENQPKKRARAGTATPKRTTPNDLPTSLEAELDESMAVDFTSPREGIAITVGHADSIARHVPWGWKLIGALIDNAARFVEEKQPMDNAVIARFLHATIEDEMETLYTVQKTFGSGSLPKDDSYKGGVLPACVWVRVGDEIMAKRLPKLMKGGITDSQWRPVGERSFVIWSPIIAAWPIPLWLAPDTEASTVWGFEVEKDSEEAVVIGAMKAALEQSYVGMFSREVRY